MYKTVGYIGLFMSAFFMFAGGYIAVNQILGPPPNIFDFEFTYFKAHPERFNYLAGLLLIAYGIFRFYRSYKVLKGQQI